jgi:hypothetical protein
VQAIEREAGMPRVLPPTSDDRALWDAWMSGFRFQALAAADELGVFQLLDGRIASANEVAAELKLGAVAAETLLGVLVALGLIDRRDGTYSLSDVGRNYLLPGSPYYWGPGLRIFRDIPVTFEPMLGALRGDRTPDPVVEESEAEPAEGMQREAADSALRWTRAMHSLSFPAAMGLALRGEFVGARRMLDIGGGSGSYCIALALKHPEMRFTVADTPEVCPATQHYIAQYGLADRIDTLPFDMHGNAWPAGYDVHFFANIFHGQEQDRCVQLARSSFAALLPGGRICLHEVLLSDTGDGPLTAVLFSAAMRYFNGHGKQFSAPELGAILQEAGFTGIRTVASYGYYSLVCGRKPA